jgi:alpha-galactosidase
MKSVSDYVHSKGLKFGLYSNAGPITCSGRLPGHLGHETIDVKTFVEWEIDYVKSDNCYPKGKNETNVDKYEINFPKSAVEGCVVQSPAERYRYGPMMSALEAARGQRNITFELCLYGWDHVEKWGATSGDHLWRASRDIADTWKSIMYNVACLDSDRFFKTSGPTTGWAYGDALQVGHKLSDDEYRSHFALWCITKSPLMISFPLDGRAQNDTVRCKLAVLTCRV